MACANEFDLDEGESFKIFKLQIFLCLPLLKLTIQVLDGFIHMCFPSCHQSQNVVCNCHEFFFFVLMCSWGLAFVVANSQFD